MRRKSIEGKVLDAIEGTPILDVKPYFPIIDSKPDAKVGWLEGKFRL